MAQKDQPVKENDHTMDEIRYFAMEVFRPKRSGFCAIATGKGKQVITERRRIDCRGGNGAGKRKKILKRWGGDTPQQSRRDRSRVGHFISWNRQG